MVRNAKRAPFPLSFSGGGSDKTKRVVLKRKQQRQFVPAK
jgi:hypothetical protein